MMAAEGADATAGVVLVTEGFGLVTAAISVFADAGLVAALLLAVAAGTAFSFPTAAAAGMTGEEEAGAAETAAAFEAAIAAAAFVLGETFVLGEIFVLTAAAVVVVVFAAAVAVGVEGFEEVAVAAAVILLNDKTAAADLFAREDSGVRTVEAALVVEDETTGEVADAGRISLEATAGTEAAAAIAAAGGGVLFVDAVVMRCNREELELSAEGDVSADPPRRVAVRVERVQSRFTVAVGSSSAGS